MRAFTQGCGDTDRLITPPPHGRGNGLTSQVIHGDTGMDLTGTGIPKGSCLGVDNVEPDIVTSGGPPTLLPPYHQGGRHQEKTNTHG